MGKKASKETRKKLSIARSGEKNPMYGKKGKDNPLFGRKRSKEVIRKISETRLRNKLKKKESVVKSANI